MADAVLVAGGAGYIGSHVCKALAAAGFVPVVLDDLSSGHADAVRWGPLVRGDIADRALVAETVARHGIVAALHFASFIQVGESVADPAKYWANNVAGSLHFFDALRIAGVKRVVFSSTAAVYGSPESVPIDEEHPKRPTSPYGATKLACEQILRDFSAAYGLRAVALRYFNAAGADPDGQIGEEHEPETHLIPVVLQAAAGRRPHIAIFGDDWPTADGTCIRDFIHVTDLAAAHVAALTRTLAGDEALMLAVNLGTGSGHSVRSVIEVCRSVTGKPIATRTEPRRAGDPAVLVASAARAREELGWAARRSDLPTIVADAWAWHRQTWQA